MPIINTSGTILSESGTTLAVGEWYAIPANFGNPSWQLILEASSAGATAGTTVYIEVANTNDDAYAVRVHTMALTCTTDTVSTGGSLAGSTYDGAWRLIRANMNSLTTSTAGSAGSPSATVHVSLQKLG
jgi:hypothetical protein